MPSADASMALDAERTPRGSPWRRELVELLLVGGGTLVLFPLAWLARAHFGLDAAELAVGFVAFHAAHVINDPHFSVTYVLFYRDARSRAFGDVFAPAQRIRYWIAGALVPLVLAVWAVAAIAKHSAQGLGWMMQLMFLLVGWHYAKQGFGVLAVLSARRGVRFERGERAVFLVHCFAGWAFAWANPADPGREVEEKGVVFTMFAHGPGLERVALGAFALSTVLLVWVLAKKWRTERRLPPLTPLVGYLVTIWLWTIFTSLDPLMVYLIPALHSVQYLYFVWLLARNEARAKEGPPEFGRPVRTQLGILAASALGLGWLLFHGAPDVLDSATAARRSTSPELLGDLGPTPWAAAFFAFVNIHHYFMDHVIWRRENPTTRHLAD